MKRLPDTRTIDGKRQPCRGALELGEPLHDATTYTTLHYLDHVGREHRYHFCDQHPPKAANVDYPAIGGLHHFR